VYKKGDFHSYDSLYEIGHLLNFINKLLYPVVNLENLEDFNEFTNYEEEYEEENSFFKVGDFMGLKGAYTQMAKHVRVFALIHDKDEYKNEIK
jgi:hypothetical protein